MIAWGIATGLCCIDPPLDFCSTCRLLWDEEEGAVVLPHLLNVSFLVGKGELAFMNKMPFISQGLPRERNKSRLIVLECSRYSYGQKSALAMN